MPSYFNDVVDHDGEVKTEAANHFFQQSDRQISLDTDHMTANEYQSSF